MITEAYKQALVSPERHQIYKIEWMDKNENVIDSITTDTLEGSISIELTNGTRRSCNLTLKNNDGRFIPGKDNVIYLSKKFKVYSGLLIDGIEVFPDESIQGVFNIGNPVIESVPSNEIVTLEGYDNFALLNGNISGQLEGTYIIDIGNDLENSIITLFSDAGIIKAPLIYTTSQLTPYTMTKEAGSTYEDMLTDFANMLSWVVYFDVNGRPNFRPPVDEYKIYHSWTFNKDTDSFLSYSKTYDYLNVKNNIVVFGDNINGDLAYATNSDISIFSPTSIARIGKRTKVITDTLIETDEMAADRAAYELKLSTLASEYVDIRCLNIDFLKEGDVILLNDTENEIEYQRYIIKQIDRNLKFDQDMGITAWRVREVT
jgi:hypothetical protein